jgi:hypothetical protein
VEHYLSWEDLLAEEPAEETLDGADSNAAESIERGGTAAEFPGDFQLPKELQALLADKERLEQELKELTGDAEPSQEDERMKRMFPVKAHTKESRIEERRLKNRDEQRRLQEKRRLEQRLVLEQASRRRTEREVLRRREEAERERVRASWDRERHRALVEAARERMLKALWAERRERRRDDRKDMDAKDFPSRLAKLEERSWAARHEEERLAALARRRDERREEARRESRRASRSEAPVLSEERERNPFFYRDAAREQERRFDRLRERSRDRPEPPDDARQRARERRAEVQDAERRPNRLRERSFDRRSG